MKLAKHDLVAALGLRYDHHSAQGLFDAACKNAGLADQSHYTAGEVAAFRAALGKLGDRLQRVDERLDSLLGEEPAPANVPQDPAPMPAVGSQSADPKPANVPQDPTPMPAADAATPTAATDKPAPANVPQDPTPMPAAQPGAKPAPANVPQDPTPMPAADAATTTSTPAAADKPAPANVPQDPTPMPAALTDAKPAPAKPANVPQDPTPMPAAQPDAKPAPANVPQDPTPMSTAQPANAPQAAAPMPAATRIILSGVQVADGERIYVCGDRPELGNWDPDRARPLTREGDAWSTSVEQGGGEFKFLRRSADGKVIWEGGENRELGTALQIETRWQS